MARVTIQSDLTQEYLKSILFYDPETGVFLWLVPPKYHPKLKGQPAGCKSTGYLMIRIDGQKYKAHRLAWLYVYGRWPDGDLDHEDTDTFNNVFENIRPCSVAQNIANRRRDAGKSLPKGVRPMWNGFQARIGFENRSITLGTFPTVDQAAQAYFAKAKELYGDFARAA
jgi:hypothetical protein